jgi:uncharacterized protein (TIGR03437 family)
MKIRGCSFVVCLGLLSLSAGRGQQYTINTIAGTAGTAGFVGDGGAPSAAEFSSPSAVALDSSGNLYIADTVNHCIRKISGNIITTIAGTGGTAGYSGDLAAATAAYLSSPSALAFDSSGNLYIADTGNNVIRKISGTTISTVVGIQGQGGAYGGDLGPATSANLNQPTDIAFDSAGNYYISDNANERIRRVDTAGNITTYVGATGGTNGTSGKLNAPNGLGFDASGALYIADSGNNRLAKYIPPSSFTNFAGNESPGFGGDGGPASSAQISKPVGLTFDAAGSIYFTDTNNSRIRKITPDGIITTIAGSRFTGYSGDGGPATSAALSFPRSIAISPNGTVYIADTGNHVIRTLTPTYPAIASNGVANAASYATRISPGSLASIFGSGFGASTFTADAGFAWPTIANQVSVKVNGVAAPLYFVSPGQINFQVPWATPATGTVNVAVVVNGGSSNVVAVPVATAAPGLFVLPSGQAAVLNPDYSVNDPSNPAKVGTTIFAYLTGSGPLSSAAKDGVPASTTSLVYLQASASATIDNLPATVSFAGLAPGFVGLVQMNIVVPAGLAPGTYPLSVTIDGQNSNAAPITVK